MLRSVALNALMLVVPFGIPTHSAHAMPVPVRIEVNCRRAEVTVPAGSWTVRAGSPGANVTVTLEGPASLRLNIAPPTKPIVLAEVITGDGRVVRERYVLCSTVQP